MRDDEFTSYAAARWPAMVRCLVLMGLPPRHAETVAAVALADLAVAWRDRDTWPDVDVPAYAGLLAAVVADDVPWWAAPVDDRAVQGTGLAELEPTLDALGVADRWRLVLEGVALLATDQVDEVLGEGPRSGPTSSGSPSPEALGPVALGITVGPVPTGAVLDVAHRRRRRRGGLTGVVTAVVVGVVVLAAVYVGHEVTAPSPVPDARTSSTATSTPTAPGVGRTDHGVAPIAWVAGPKLHLATRTVRVPRVAAVTSSGTGAVLTTTTGRVLFVNDQGSIQILGATRPGDRVAADSGSGLVAWTDRATRRLVTFDVTTGAEPTSVHADGPARVAAIDGGRVFWSDDGGGHQSTGAVTTDLHGPPVLDVAGSLSLVQADASHLRAEAPSLSGGLTVRGVGAEISDDGRFVLSHEATGVRGVGGPPFVVDLRTDRSINLPLPELPVTVDVALGPHDTATYVLRFFDAGQAVPNGSGSPSDGATYQLVTCSLITVHCALDRQLTHQPRPPLLAH